MECDFGLLVSIPQARAADMQFIAALMEMWPAVDENAVHRKECGN
jgi:hypothetical protein